MLLRFFLFWRMPSSKVEAYLQRLGSTCSTDSSPKPHCQSVHRLCSISTFLFQIPCYPSNTVSVHFPPSLLQPPIPNPNIILLKLPGSQRYWTKPAEPVDNLNGWDSKFDLQSQCGSTWQCNGSSTLEIHFLCCWDLNPLPSTTSENVRAGPRAERPKTSGRNR